MKKDRPRTWSELEFKTAVQQSISIAEVLTKLNLKIGGGNYKLFHLTTQQLGIDTKHFKGQGHGKTSLLAQRGSLRPFKEILVEDSDYLSSNHLKKRLVKAGLLENSCQICGLTNEWQGLPLTLRLDHINGKPTDHRLENLRLVCPNCDSQLPTFCRSKTSRFPKTSIFCENCGNEMRRKSKTGLCHKCVRSRQVHHNQYSDNKRGRNKCYCNICDTELGKGQAKYCSLKCLGIANRKVERPSARDLLKALSESNFLAVSRKYGVSDNTIRKWVRSYKITQ